MNRRQFHRDMDSLPKENEKVSEPIKYVAERIVNINELEDILQESYVSNISAIALLEKDSYSKEDVMKLLSRTADLIIQAINFEFCIERRTTIDSK